MMQDFICDLPVIGDFMAQRPKVAVVRLSGVLADHGMRKGGLSYAKYADLIEQAFAVKGVREVALVINSPGGAPAQASLLSGVIRQCASEKKMPVTAFVEDVAASGGYWLACAADKIYVQPSSLVGSIGVIASGFGFEDFIKKHDVHRRVYTAGHSKSMLDPFLPEKREDVERVKALQSEIHAQFIAWVKDRRGQRIKGSDGDLFEGQIWTGVGAINTGLADAVGDVRGVYHEKYGHDVRLMEFAPERPFLQSLFSAKGPNAKGPGDDFVAQALGVLEERSEWSRFGL